METLIDEPVFALAQRQTAHRLSVWVTGEYVMDTHSGMEQTEGARAPAIRFGALDAAIVGLTLATAAIHVALAVERNLIPFYLNGAGYVALLVGFYASAARCVQRHKRVAWALLGYTGLTIVLWVARGQRTEIAYVDKVIEVLLAGAAWLAVRRAAAAQRRRSAAADAAGDVRPAVVATVAGALLALVAAGAMTVGPAAQVAGAQVQERSAEAVARAWVDALNAADTEGAIALYADDAAVVALGREFAGKAAIAQRQRSTIGPVLFPSLEIEALQVDADTARLRLKGENAITRMDGHGPVVNTVTLTVANGKIVREEGPALSAPDMAWYREAAQRFQAAQAGAMSGTGVAGPRAPSALPRTGAVIDGWPSMPALFAGLLSAAGLVALLTRRTQLALVPAEAREAPQKNGASSAGR
jgi:ketosteroid isomerase-like protein